MKMKREKELLKLKKELAKREESSDEEEEESEEEEVVVKKPKKKIVYVKAKAPQIPEALKMSNPPAPPAKRFLYI